MLLCRNKMRLRGCLTVCSTVCLCFILSKYCIKSNMQYFISINKGVLANYRAVDGRYFGNNPILTTSAFKTYAAWRSNS